MKKAILIAALASSLLAPAAAHAKRVNLSMTFGQDVLLARNGEVSLRARCVLNDGGFDSIEVYATTTSNAVMRAAFSYYPGNGSYLTAATAPDMSLVASYTGATGVEAVTNSIDGSYLINATSLHGFAVRVESSMLGLNVSGKHCLLSLDYTAIKKFKAPKL